MSGNAHFLRDSNLAGYALGLISVFSPLAVAQSQAPLDLSSISQEALRADLRLRRDQVMLEFSYTLDGAAPKPTADDHCRPASNWQGWGAIIYREVSGDKDKGNPTKGDIIREVNEERYRTNRGINSSPAQIPEPR